MNARANEVGAVAALALVLTVAMATPVLRAPSERTFGMETVGRHHDPFTVMEQLDRPIAVDLYSQPLTDLPGAWLARVSGPVAAYNWLVLLTFPLAAVAAYVLARHLAIRPAGATLAALAFAFSPFHIAQAAYHPHIAQTQWIPLYLFALWRCLDAATPARIAFLVASIAAVTLSNFYGGLIAATVTPAALFAYWYVRARHDPRSVRHLGLTVGTLALVAGGGVAYAWYVAPIVFTGSAPLAFRRVDLFLYSAKWWSYLMPPVAHPLVGASAARAWSAAGVHLGLLEQQVSLGWGIVALGLVALVAWLPRGEPTRSIAIVPVLAIVAAVALLCSLSPERTIGPFTFVRPSALFYKAVPMFRSYARFGVAVQLMAVLLAAIGAERLWFSGSRRARIACATLVTLAVLEYAVWPAALWRDVLPTSAHRWVMQQRGPVRALDCASVTTESRSVEWLADGRIALRGGRFDDCREPNLAGKLAAAGYTHLIVRRQTVEGEWFAMRPPPAGLRSAARFRDGQVFLVTAPTPLVYTAQMLAFSPREHDATWTWRRMETHASWQVVNTTGMPLVADVDVELTARGACRLTVLLDGQAVQALTVGGERGLARIGPLALSPGEHALGFEPDDSVAGDGANDGDRASVSLDLGTWHWAVSGVRP
jgi:hypothetical protein